MSYRRVIPRDLFNESKLLKCLGRLALILNDYPGKYPLALDHIAPEAGFIIERDDSSGNLYCVNLHLRKTNNKHIFLFSCLNSKENYPLVFKTGDGGEETVFNDDGSFTDEFIEFIS